MVINFSLTVDGFREALKLRLSGKMVKSLRATSLLSTRLRSVRPSVLALPFFPSLSHLALPYPVGVGPRRYDAQVNHTFLPGGWTNHPSARPGSRIVP